LIVDQQIKHITKKPKNKLPPVEIIASLYALEKCSSPGKNFFDKCPEK